MPVSKSCDARLMFLRALDGCRDIGSRRSQDVESVQKHAWEFLTVRLERSPDFTPPDSCVQVQ